VVETFERRERVVPSVPGRSASVERHLDEAAIDDAIEAAQRNDEARLVRRLCLIKNLYRGDSVTEAADRVGTTQPTASRWLGAWNDGGVDGLRPHFGGGRPPKLSDDAKRQLAAVLETHDTLPIHEVQRLVEAVFDVTYSRRHLARILADRGVAEAVTRAPSADRDDAPEDSGARFQAALDDLAERADGPATDGGSPSAFER